MYDFLDADYFDPAYMKTADGMRELQSMYDDCPMGLFPADMGSPGGSVLMLNPFSERVPAYQRLEAYIKGFYSLCLRSTLEGALWSGKVTVPFDRGGKIITVSDVCVERVYSSRGLDSDESVQRLKAVRDELVVRADVQMSANIITENMGTYDHGRKTLFRLQTYMGLMSRRFIVSGKITSGSFYESQKGMTLDDYLVPYIRVRDMEQEAKRLLDLICPEALKSPMRLDIKMILAQLGMEVRFARITPEFKFLGRVFFEEGYIEVFDSYGRKVPMHVKNGTILVDERVLRRTEAVDWTIVHEIYHFLQHREFFYLQKIYDDTLKCLSCTVEDYRELGKESPVYWIEWQTARMVARLMMPSCTVKVMADCLLEKNAYRGRIAAMEQTIIEIAEFYGVSRQTAKIRMEELGYTDAKGVLNYVDKGYIPAYYGLQKNLTPDISEDAALELYISNPEFRSLIDTGNFCFVENHFCLREEKYLMQAKNGDPALTSYARSHIDECCILFEKHPGEKQYTYSVGTFNSEIIYSGPELYRPIDIPARKPMNREEMMSKRMEIYLNALENTPLRFGPAIAYHRKSRGFSQELLAEMVNISDKQMGNYERSAVKQPKQRTVIAMCIALKLEADLSDGLLRKGGCMPGTETEDLILLYVLHTMYEYSILFCNRFLMSRHLEPLTREGIEEGEAAS